LGNTDGTVLELSTVSSYAHMDEFAALVGKAARLIGVSEDEEVDLMIAVMEAVNNAILHGNCEDEDKHVHMKIEAAPARLTIWVGDEGDGFDLGTVPNPLDPGNVLNTSGRGILMMRAFMDEVEIVPSGCGTEVKMTKRFSPQKS